MSVIQINEIVRVTNPSHDKLGMQGVVRGAFVVDGEILSYAVQFAQDEELIDPEDIEQTGDSISEADFENGLLPPA